MVKQYISKAIGIDLGTTNSVVGIMNPADSEVILHKDSRNKRETTPSCVWKDPRTGQIVVGSKAYARLGHVPMPIRSIKRQMGKQAKVRLTDEMLAPEEVSAHILREMKRQIEEDVARFNTQSTHWQVDRAIITVPAYFDMPQIEATRKAGEMAGLQVLELLHEPSAAACYHCWHTGINNGLFLVYDLGGGTFDVSVLRCTEGAFEVLGISGNNWLGGDDIDTALAELLQQRLQAEGYQLDLDLKKNEEDQLLFYNLRLLMEGVKKTLSTSYEMVLRDTRLIDKAGERIDIECPFERYEIEILMRPIIERTIPYCFEALEIAHQKAGVTLADVDQIILAGGSTHIPLVREMVRQALCADPAAKEPRARCSEPVYDRVDSIVALGAAIRAATTGGLEIYNPARTVRVTFTGMGITNEQKTHISGKVERLDPSIDLRSGAIRLIFPGLDYEDEEDLDTTGTFSFKHVPLQTAAENLLTCEILDSSGRIVASVDRSFTQDASASAVRRGDTAVLSKDILLDVNRAGEVFRLPLCKAMTSLPASAHFQLVHPGGTEEVRFTLYQQRKKIYEIPVRVPLTLPKGTPIDLDVSIDELAFVTVKGTIGRQPFTFSVESPPDRTPPTVEEIARLDEQFHKTVTTLPAEQQSIAEQQWRSLETTRAAAVKRGDNDQLNHVIEEQENMLDRLAPSGKELKPPLTEFDQLVKECYTLNQLAAFASESVPYDAAEIEKSIEFEQQQGEKAYAAGDQRAYSRAIEMLQNHRNHAVAIIQKKFEESDDRTPEEKLADALEFAARAARDIQRDAQAQGRADLQARIQAIQMQLNRLRTRIRHDPDGARAEFRELYNELQQIYNILNRGGDGDNLRTLPILHI